MAKNKIQEELKLPEFKVQIFSRLWVLGRGEGWFWFCLGGFDWLCKYQNNGFPMIQSKADYKIQICVFIIIVCSVI